MSLHAIDQLFAEIRTTPIGELYERLSAKPTPTVAPKPATSPTGVLELDGLVAELVRKNVSYKELGDIVIKSALKTAGGNKSAAARLIGMDRKAFERRLRRVKK